MAIPKRHRLRFRGNGGVTSMILHLPPQRNPGAGDFSFAGLVLFLVGVGIYSASHLPQSEPKTEESLILVAEDPPAPVEVKDPPKPPPPPPEPVAKQVIPDLVPPLPVFGLQEDEMSAAGDLAVANGNTLAVKPVDIVQPPPPPLPTHLAAPIELDHAPAFLKQVLADYPVWAQDQGVEAVVLVWVIIDSEGHVKETILKRGAGKDFDSAAIKAAKASLFQPLVQKGVTLPSRFVVTYEFRLEG